MKKIAALIIATILLSAVTSRVLALDLEYVRKSYEQAVKNEKLCSSLIEQLSGQTNNVVYLGYLGAFQTIWANHTSNPLAKLNTFNKGKKHIEQAIKAAPDNVELRFIRLSIQVNCPDFLNYSSNIKEDKKFIKTNLHKIESKSLTAMCNKLI
ncbi:MAG: hypothetical protein BGO31_08450 [Bacteroidetes bacterium 43-16]|nr:MAG: hypothetical protein BGO31_08450 [Bacteroidetes bacterium 43-16]